MLWCPDRQQATILPKMRVGRSSQTVMETLRIGMMRRHLKAYREAMRVLAANHTTVAERKAAIDIRDEFQIIAPAYVNELIAGFDLLVAYTDGEECADPDSCNLAHGNPVWLCSRCRLREFAR